LDEAAEFLRREVPQATKQLTATLALADLAACDLILEAVIESLKVKRQVFAELDALAAPDTIFASNTSCLRIAQIGDGLKTRERLCGLHFCHPVRQRPLVEVVGAESTAESVLATACGYVRKLGMEVLRVTDTPGFVVNRILYPYVNESLLLLSEGAGIEEVDAAAVTAGMPWGPLTQIDEIGIDVVLRGGQVMAQAYPECAAPPELLIALFGLGRLGRKKGAGFYRYGEGQPPVVDAEMRELLRQHTRPGQVAHETLGPRLLGRMAREGRRIVADGVVAGFDDVERALLRGLGFDPRKVADLRGA
jgi:3-hydroxyacyl-CoA dehydrogenase/enoyl-CoA hydratase/3-hydroxybutyryl-CoA epimerase/3-hydroxyacyl-CoA dehydrogenase/enoyl-CoA hydratase/3-hydroxybutyryl-CoA epimerase/enoyl-CoA isomerase